MNAKASAKIVQSENSRLRPSSSPAVAGRSASSGASSPGACVTALSPLQLTLTGQAPAGTILRNPTNVSKRTIVRRPQAVLMLRPSLLDHPMGLGYYRGARSNEVRGVAMGLFHHHGKGDGHFDRGSLRGMRVLKRLKDITDRRTREQLERGLDLG